MTKLYRIPVTIAATMYVKAGSLAEAIAHAKEEVTTEIHLSRSDERISGLSFDDPELPEVSFSPACTVESIDGSEAEELP